MELDTATGVDNVPIELVDGTVEDDDKLDEQISVAQFDEDFKRRLIEWVRRYRYLYDSKHRFHNNLRICDESWTQIGAQLGQDGKLCKKMWQGLRKLFFRYDRKYKAGTQQPTWLYYEPLSFLKNFMSTNYKQSYESQQSAATTYGVSRTTRSPLNAYSPAVTRMGGSVVQQRPVTIVKTIQPGSVSKQSGGTPKMVTKVEYTSEYEVCDAAQIPNAHAGVTHDYVTGSLPDDAAAMLTGYADDEADGSFQNVSADGLQQHSDPDGMQGGALDGLRDVNVDGGYVHQERNSIVRVVHPSSTRDAYQQNVDVSRSGYLPARHVVSSGVHSGLQLAQTVGAAADSQFLDEAASASGTDEQFANTMGSTGADDDGTPDELAHFSRYVAASLREIRNGRTRSAAMIEIQRVLTKYRYGFVSVNAPAASHAHAPN